MTHAHAGIPLVLGSKTALDDVLAGAVVPNTHAEKAGEDSGGGEHLIFGTVEDLEFGGDLVHEMGEAADAVKPDHRHEDSCPRRRTVICMKSVHAADLRPPYTV